MHLGKDRKYQLIKDLVLSDIMNNGNGTRVKVRLESIPLSLIGKVDYYHTKLIGNTV